MEEGDSEYCQKYCDGAEKVLRGFAKLDNYRSILGLCKSGGELSDEFCQAFLKEVESFSVMLKELLEGVSNG